MRNRFRVLAFDVLAPLGAILALVYLGIALAWPLWWVSVCSVLCLLIVQAVVINVVLLRRDGVTVGTDDDGPGLRLAVVGLTTAALAAAVIVGYTQWTAPAAQANRDMAEVVGIASSAAEASATFTPQSPSANLDRLTALMTTRGADAFRGQFDSMSKDLTGKGLTVTASTVSAGVEAIGPEAAVVAVIMRGTQNGPGRQPSSVALPLRISLLKQDGRWLVDDLSPINSR